MSTKRRSKEERRRNRKQKKNNKNKENNISLFRSGSNNDINSDNDVFYYKTSSVSSKETLTQEKLDQILDNELSHIANEIDTHNETLEIPNEETIDNFKYYISILRDSTIPHKESNNDRIRTFFHNNKLILTKDAECIVHYIQFLSEINSKEICEVFEKYESTIASELGVEKSHVYFDYLIALEELKEYEKTVLFLEKYKDELKDEIGQEYVLDCYIPALYETKKYVEVISLFEKYEPEATKHNSCIENYLLSLDKIGQNEKSKLCFDKYQETIKNNKAMTIFINNDKT